MRKSERAAQARREIDRKFAAADLSPVLARPRGGWIRAIRAGLGMSQEALATRLDVTKANIAKLERSELAETISIGKLAEVRLDVTRGDRGEQLRAEVRNGPDLVFPAFTPRSQPERTPVLD